jgi:hypothetical protein
MAFYLIASITIIALGVAALLWIYNPWLRRPWLPTDEAQERARRVVREADGPIPLERPRVVVHKAARSLELFDGDRLIKTYPVALGTNPVDPKRKEGDGCTPEGAYIICTKNERSRFHLFLGISYPNIEDADCARSPRRPKRAGGRRGTRGSAARSACTAAAREVTGRAAASRCRIATSRSSFCCSTSGPKLSSNRR